ncbi:MAG: MarR family transcriptional regulator [Candidatus Omnitrophica bacterium]|nr:MarR family transcriptional regulator [Candidatus Omnitrophota bacterium]
MARISFSISEFADKIGEVFPIVIKEFLKRQTNELCKGNITMPQFLILNFLEKEGGSKMTELARFMNVTTAAMTGIVDRLVREGYAGRVYDPKDRRIIRIKTMAKGSGLVRKINLQRRQMIIDIFGRLSEQDRDDYLKVIMRIRDMLAAPALKNGVKYE